MCKLCSKLTRITGTACRPYPQWRYPGWNRLSAGLHLDDMRKFFENPDGGEDYPQAPKQVFNGDVIGCGYQFSNGELFFTYNGGRLPAAFHGLYFPRDKQDVYAAIGVGEENVFEVNFGGDMFLWKPGNNTEWKISEQFLRLNNGGTNDIGDELPAYSRV
jgi:Ran-binding protein 9/10